MCHLYHHPLGRQSRLRCLTHYNSSLADFLLLMTSRWLTSRFSLIDDRLRDLSDIPFGRVKSLICSRLLDVQPKISYARGRFHGKERQIQINGTLKMALRETMHKHEQLAGRVRRVGPGYSVSTDSLKPKAAFSCGGTYW